MLYLCFRLGRFLQAIVEERPAEQGDVCIPSEGVFGSNEEGGLTPLDLNWGELTYSKTDVKVYEHSGAKPSPRSTFRLRYVSFFFIQMNIRNSWQTCPCSVNVH